MDLRTRTIIETISGQRNAAHDMLAAVLGENATLRAELEELKALLSATRKQDNLGEDAIADKQRR